MKDKTQNNTPGFTTGIRAQINTNASKLEKQSTKAKTGGGIPSLIRWLNPIVWAIGWLFLLGAVGCGKTFIPTPTVISPNTPIPNTATPSPTPENFIETEIAAAHLILSLPDTWLVGEGQITPLGLVINLGPEPLGPGPFSSTIVIANPSEYDAAALAAALSCSTPCNIELADTLLAGQPAQRAVLGIDSTTPLEWYFLEHGGQLIAFTLHDAFTLITHQDIVDSLTLVDVVVVVPTPTITPTPLPPTETPTPPPPTPTFGPPAEEPLDVVLAFLRAAANDPETLGITYLSNTLRTRVGQGETLLELIELEQGFSTFEVLFLGNQDGALIYRANLNLTDGTDAWRRITVTAEEGEWVMSGFQIIAPPETAATPESPTTIPDETSTTTPEASVTTILPAE